MEQQALHQALYQALVRSGLAVPSRSGKGQFEIVAGEMDCRTWPSLMSHVLGPTATASCRKVPDAGDGDTQVQPAYNSVHANHRTNMWLR